MFVGIYNPDVANCGFLPAVGPEVVIHTDCKSA